MSSLQELTRAYIAVEGLLRSPLLSETTRQQLELFLVELDMQIVEAMRKQMKEPRPSDAAAD